MICRAWRRRIPWTDAFTIEDSFRFESGGPACGSGDPPPMFARISQAASAASLPKKRPALAACRVVPEDRGHPPGRSPGIGEPDHDPGQRLIEDHRAEAQTRRTDSPTRQETSV